MSDEPDFEDEPPVWWPKLDEMPTDCGPAQPRLALLKNLGG
jgi:hypothetical protein